MLGSELASQLSKNHQVYATGHNKIHIDLNYKAFDLLNSDYNELIEWSSPDLIIHCAAITDGNFCEENPFIAFAVNSFSLKKLIDHTDESVRIIYISTDAVFDSSLIYPDESKCTNPSNIYGKSKQLGEFFLINSKRKNFLILRTTIVGINKINPGNSFVEWIISCVKTSKNISLFDDVIFNPISIWDFIEEIIFLINKKNYISNILHLAGGENCSKYVFGKKLIESLNLPSEYIQKGSIKNFTERANRSSNQSINCNRYETKYFRNLPNTNETINSISKNY